MADFEAKAPSQVFLALWRWRAIHENPDLDEFAELASTWAEIVRMEQREAWADLRRSFGASDPDTETDTGTDTEAPHPSAAPTPSPQGKGKDTSSVAGGDSFPSRGSRPDQGIGTSEEDREGEEAAEDDGELGARFIDEIEAKPSTYTGYMSSIKNATRTRLLEMRAAGLTTAKLMDAARGRISQGDYLNILEAKPVRFDVYEKLAAVLDEIGQDGDGAPHPSAAPTPSPQGEGRGGG